MLAIGTNANALLENKRRYMTTNAGPDVVSAPEQARNDVISPSPSCQSVKEMNSSTRSLDQDAFRARRADRHRQQRKSNKSGAHKVKTSMVRFAPSSEYKVMLITPYWKYSAKEKEQLFYSTTEINRMGLRERLRKQVATLAVSLFRIQVQRFRQRRSIDDIIPIHQTITLYHQILVSISERMNGHSPTGENYDTDSKKIPKQNNLSSKGASIKGIKTETAKDMEMTSRPTKRRRRQYRERQPCFYPTTAKLIAARAA